MARMEFYLGSSAGCLAVLDDGAVPRKGEMISIRKTTYKVLRVTWAIGQASDPHNVSLRANVELDNV